MTYNPLQDILSLYWLVVPNSELTKIKFKGKVLLTNHDKIAETLLDREYFDCGLEPWPIMLNKIAAAKAAKTENHTSLLLLCDRDMKEIKRDIKIKVIVYEDFIEEKNIGKIFGIRRY